MVRQDYGAWAVRTYIASELPGCGRPRSCVHRSRGVTTIHLESRPAKRAGTLARGLVRNVGLAAQRFVDKGIRSGYRLRIAVLAAGPAAKT